MASNPLLTGRKDGFARTKGDAFRPRRPIDTKYSLTFDRIGADFDDGPNRWVGKRHLCCKLGRPVLRPGRLIAGETIAAGRKKS